MHDSWKALRSRIMEYLEKTTIADLAAALEQKRRALEKPRKAKKVAVAGASKKS
jgi:DNA-binding IscR family transcriptional regulator